MLPNASDVEEGDQCFIFGCTGHFRFSNEADLALICDRCGQNLPEEKNEAHKGYGDRTGKGCG